MTSADAPAPHRRSAALARGWHSFRRWRRGRPFWGGLFLILAGVEILASGGVKLGELQVRVVGLSGLLYYLIPTILILCGLLGWLTPAQRIFYGVLGAIVSVGSLVGVNFGGWFIGMLLGIVGGALVASWVPITPVGSADPPEQEESETDESDVDGPGRERDATVDDLMTGPLTDVLPPSTASPVTVPRAAGKPHAGPAHAAPTSRDAADEDATAEGSLPRRSPPTLAMILVPLVVAAAALVAGPGSRPAYADPCPAPKPPITVPKPPGPVPPAPVPPKPAPTATAPPTPTPSPTATTQQGNPLGNLIGGVLGAIGDLLGIGGQQPTSSQPAAPAGAPPAAGATAAGAAAPAAGAPKAAAAPRPGQPTPTCGPPAAPAKARVLAVPAGTPNVAARPGKLTGDSVTIVGFFFHSVTELRRADGSTVRVLRFHMDSSTVTNFKLITFDAAGKPITITTQALTVAGNVEFYASRFAGKIGPIELVFTPDFPPPPIPIPSPIPLIFGDPEIDLVFVDCDRLTGRPLLHIEPK